MKDLVKYDELEGKKYCMSVSFPFIIKWFPTLSSGKAAVRLQSLAVLLH